MVGLIIFCGPQLSGKTTLAKRVATQTKLPFISIDEVRLKLFGHLTGPRDWKTPQNKERENAKTKFAYDCLFLIIKKCLDAKVLLVVEMPYLAHREVELIKTARQNRIKLKIIWCQISNDSDEEIEKRVHRSKTNAKTAPISLADYRMFKNKIKKPTSKCLILDTSQSINVCLIKIRKYLEKK